MIIVAKKIFQIHSLKPRFYGFLSIFKLLDRVENDALLPAVWLFKLVSVCSTFQFKIEKSFSPTSVEYIFPSFRSETI